MEFDVRQKFGSWYQSPQSIHTFLMCTIMSNNSYLNVFITINIRRKTAQ